MGGEGGGVIENGNLQLLGVSGVCEKEVRPRSSRHGGGGNTGATASLKTASTRKTHHLRGHHALRFKVEGAESG